MIRFCAALSIVLGASTALADNYYNILKDEFRSARDAVDFSDVDKAGHPDAKTCIEVHPDQPNQELLVQVNRFTKYKEGQGPLLPGKTITKIIYRKYSTDPFRGGDFEFVTSEDGTREVTSSLSRFENRGWELRVRKTFGTLVYRRMEKQGDDTVRFYGYCYVKGSEEKERP